MADNRSDNVAGFLWSGINVRRKNADGTTTVYCRQCGRPIVRMVRPTITTVSKCALCIAYEQGIPNPEKAVLPQYIIVDPTQPPIPLNEEDDPLEALYPELASEEAKKKKIPMVGGMVGTAKAIFRAIIPESWLKPAEEQPKEVLLSKTVTRKKRGGGLFER